MNNDQTSNETNATPQKVETSQEQSTEQVQGQEATEANDTLDPKAKELQDKLAQQGREKKELQEKINSMESKLEELQNAGLSEQEKAQKALEKAQKELAEKEQRILQSEIKATVATLTAQESELPEIKQLLPFIKGNSVEEATENFNKAKEALQAIKQTWESGNTGKPTFPAPINSKYGKTTQSEYESLKQKAETGDKDALKKLFSMAKIIKR